MNTELVLADLYSIQKRRTKQQKLAKGVDKMPPEALAGAEGAVSPTDPAEIGLPRFASRFEQPINFQSLLWREIGGERGVGLASCPGATGERQAFDHGQSGNHDPASANFSNE